METVTLAPNVHWVGAKDPGLTVFDIVIPTEFGTTYNAYLVRGTEKTALIDCVKKEFTEDLFRNISRILPVEKLDYVVINHSEPDHAGGIVDLLKRNPAITVFLSRSALWVRGTGSSAANLRGRWRFPSTSSRQRTQSGLDKD